MQTVDDSPYEEEEKVGFVPPETDELDEEELDVELKQKPKKQIPPVLALPLQPTVTAKQISVIQHNDVNKVKW